MFIKMDRIRNDRLSDVEVTIVGAGPAGCSAALWLKQLGLQVMLLETSGACGGLQNKNPFTNTWIATNPHATGASVAKALRESMVPHKIPHRVHTKVEHIESAGSQGWVVHTEQGECIQSPYVVLAHGVGFSTSGLLCRAQLAIGPTKFEDSAIAGKRVAYGVVAAKAIHHHWDSQKKKRWLPR